MVASIDVKPGTFQGSGPSITERPALACKHTESGQRPGTQVDGPRMSIQMYERAKSSKKPLPSTAAEGSAPGHANERATRMSLLAYMKCLQLS